MPDYWVLPGGDRLVHLHRSEKFTPEHETLPPITFSVGGWAGVRVKDILGYSGPPVVVDCANDTPMKQFGWRSTVISLEVSFIYTRPYFLPRANRCEHPLVAWLHPTHFPRSSKCQNRSYKGQQADYSSSTC